MSKNAYAEKLTLLDPLREPLFRSLIHSLKLTEGSRGLDIGCGIGSNTLILADAVGESGHVRIPEESGHRFRCKVGHPFRSKLDQVFRGNPGH